MRDRHFPRLCRSCEAPMARQEGACWRCGAPWVDRERTPMTHRSTESMSLKREGTPVSTPPPADAAILVEA
jgi:predicted amidophosphoribosyltransferase